MQGLRSWWIAAVVGHAGAAGLAAQTWTPPPPPVTVQDCSKLRGSAKKSCVADAAKSAAAEKSQPAKSGTGEMNTGEPDPPASSMKSQVIPGRDDDTPDSHKPLHMPGQDADVPGDAGSSGSSSSSSSSSGSSSSKDDALPPPPDDEAAPTTAGSDTPVKPGVLKDLGSRGDSTQARQKLEQTRVDDDLRVGRFYFKDGNYTGAMARYQDALSHDADNPDAHFGLAEVLVKQNRTADAIAHLERYLQLAPDDDHTKDAQKMLARLKR